MTKRRTKKQKSEAKHSFELSWSAGTKSATSGSAVKGQKKNTKASKNKPGTSSKSTQSKEKIAQTAQIKKDIGKSLAVASLVLGIELMIYFVS